MTDSKITTPIIKGELLISAIFFFLLVVFLLPFTFLDYVQEYIEGTIIFFIFVSLTSSFFLYKYLTIDSELEKIEKIFINLFCKKMFIKKSAKESSYKCEKCNRGNRIHNDFQNQYGIFTFLGFETTYSFFQIYCNSCRRVSEISIEK